MSLPWCFSWMAQAIHAWVSFNLWLFPMTQIVSIVPIDYFLARIILVHAQLRQHEHVYPNLSLPSVPYENRDLNNDMHRRSLCADACKTLGSALGSYSKLCTSRTFSSTNWNSEPLAKYPKLREKYVLTDLSSRPFDHDQSQLGSNLAFWVQYVHHPGLILNYSLYIESLCGRKWMINIDIEILGNLP